MDDVSVKDVAEHLVSETKERFQKLKARDGVFTAIGATVGAVAYYIFDELI